MWVCVPSGLHIWCLVSCGVSGLQITEWVDEFTRVMSSAMFPQFIGPVLFDFDTLYKKSKHKEPEKRAETIAPICAFFVRVCVCVCVCVFVCVRACLLAVL